MQKIKVKFESPGSTAIEYPPTLEPIESPLEWLAVVDEKTIATSHPVNVLFPDGHLEFRLDRCLPRRWKCPVPYEVDADAMKTVIERGEAEWPDLGPKIASELFTGSSVLTVMLNNDGSAGVEVEVLCGGDDRSVYVGYAHLSGEDLKKVFKVKEA